MTRYKAKHIDGLVHCCFCGQYKLPSEFHIDRNASSGRASMCRRCRGQYYREYQRKYYLLHRERLLPSHNKSARESNYRRKLIDSASNQQ